MLFSSLCSRKLWSSLVSAIASRRDHGPGVGMQCRVGMAARKRVNPSTWHDQRTHDVIVQPDNFPTCPSWHCHSRNPPQMLQQPPLLPQWPPHTGTCNTSAFILCNHRCDIIKVMGLFFLPFSEPLNFTMKSTCDFSSFAATGSLLSDRTTHPRDSTPVLCV